MRTFLSRLFPLVVSLPLVGCAALGQPSGRAAEASRASTREPSPRPKTVNELALESAELRLDADLDKYEANARDALAGAAGQRPAYENGPKRESSTALVQALRGSPIKLRVEPTKSSDGRAIDQQLVGLKDSFTPRLVEIANKMAAHTATPQEKKEYEAGARFVTKVGDLGGEISAVSFATWTSSRTVLDAGMINLDRVTSLVRGRKALGGALTPAEYAVIKRSLARKKRAESVTAATMGMLATYIAVVNDGGDPKALDLVATEALKAFPLKIEVSDDEAKQWVDRLGENVAAQKALYEAQLRKLYGDGQYERSFKQSNDAGFAAIGNTDAPTTKARNGSATSSGSDELDGFAGIADGSLRTSLRGISALKRGDAKTALKSALDLAPPVPGGVLVNKGLGLASKLLFGE